MGGVRLTGERYLLVNCGDSKVLCLLNALWGLKPNGLTVNCLSLATDNSDKSSLLRRTCLLSFGEQVVGVSGGEGDDPNVGEAFESLSLSEVEWFWVDDDVVWGSSNGN